jgi:hypothetical protein
VATLILTSVYLVANVDSEGNDLYKCYSHESAGLLLIEIEATALAWPGENVTILARANATQANVHIRYIHVNILSLRDNRTETLLNSKSFFLDSHLSIQNSREISYKVAIPEDTLPGLLFGEVEFQWSIEGSPDVEKEFDTFPATYIQNKPYEDLRQEYEGLYSVFNDLKTNYTQLQLNFTDLQQDHLALETEQIGQSNATGLMYLFLITTGIFIATTIILIIRNPKGTVW